MRQRERVGKREREAERERERGREREKEREREREGECERDKMRDNCSTRLNSSTSVIKRKTFRSVVFILLTIFLKSMLNPTKLLFVCLCSFFSLFAYITYFNAYLEIKYYKVNIY